MACVFNVKQDKKDKRSKKEIRKLDRNSKDLEKEKTINQDRT